MKRLFVLFAFLLVSCAVFAQDEKPQSEGTLLVVPRLDVDPAYYFGDREWSVNLGTTSLYTFFDGNIGDHFSFSIGNHWVSIADSFDDTRELYRNTWRAYAMNWVDWANVTASFGNLFLTLGKDYIHFGTFEEDAYDYASHWQLNSAFWNNYQVYQWGGSFGWNSEDESTTLMLQVTTDQLMYKPFRGSASDYAYTLFGSHEAERFKVLGSFSHCSLGWVAGLGAEFYPSDAITVATDAYLATDGYYGATAKLQAALGEKLDLLVKGGYDYGANSYILDGNRFYCGAGCYWYPLRDSHDLRVHALYGYDSFEQAMSLSFGILYELNLNIF